MKIKILTAVMTALISISLIFGVTACNQDDGVIPADGNMLTTVFGEFDDGELSLITHFVTGGAGWTDGKVDGYTVEDLATGKLPYNNYSTINLKWKSSKYRVTKIEFDMIAEKAFETEVSINNPRCVDEKNITLSAGETKHVVFNCNLENNTGLLYIYSGPSEDVKGIISWKWANLYVTAEKI